MAAGTREKEAKLLKLFQKSIVKADADGDNAQKTLAG